MEKRFVQIGERSAMKVARYVREGVHVSTSGDTGRPVPTSLWRKRTSCQEPAGTITAGLAWKADYFVNKAKNKAVCAAAQILP